MLSSGLSLALFPVKFVVICLSGPAAVFAFVWMAARRLTVTKRLAVSGVVILALYAVLIVLPAVWAHLQFGEVVRTQAVEDWANGLPFGTLIYLLSFECIGFWWLASALGLLAIGQLSRRRVWDIILRVLMIVGIAAILFNFAAYITPLNSVLE